MTSGQMITIFVVAVICALLLGGPSVPPVYAMTTCTSHAQRLNDAVCQNSPISGVKEWKELRCNYDVDCPSARPKCQAGSAEVRERGLPFNDLPVSREDAAEGRHPANHYVHLHLSIPQSITPTALLLAFLIP